MNDFEKDENLGQENEEIREAEEVSAENPDTDSELIKELEGIRDMMQEELDKAMEGGEDYLIQELYNIEEYSEEEEEEAFDPCMCCGERKRSEEYGEDYPYCEECRQLMKKYPLRFSGIAAFILMFVVLAASLYFSYPYMTDAASIAEASSDYNSGYVMSALQEYYSYFAGGKTGDAISKRAFNEAVEGYVNNGYHTNAVSLIETYYNETALSMPWNKKYKTVIEEANNLTETFNEVSKITETALSGGEFDYDEVMASLDALKKGKASEDGKSVTEYNEVFIEYYKYIVMSVNEDSMEKQFEQLKAIDAIGEGYEWVYMANYCAIAAMCSDEEAVNYSFDKLIENNIQDMTAYVSKANYYRFLETPDADKMIEVCQKAAEVATTSDLSYKHSLAIAYLLKGEGALALEEIEGLFNAGSYNVQNCNLYALCGLYTGDKDIYKEMKSLLSSYGYEISDLVTDYSKDKITLEEVLKDKGGDI